jgi:hypothetical protein
MYHERIFITFSKGLPVKFEYRTCLPFKNIKQLGYSHSNSWYIAIVMKRIKKNLFLLQTILYGALLEA